ncbi:TPA: hypothetical protein PXO06_002051 [Yersinia enterocolitica]|nr:hypothetical protein [Yersinia enterocolitica]HDL6856212.1 hypothetical protein [Yersinia enterocolitica]HDL6860146.1 hypothetical protein [Yersinia enterocolitica]HDL6863761.1 hypothetical protein [Yersinia enterocolitica]HDL6866122.1 hypothetical protein [Yersinia enterocolitica]HDL6871952.1 hypothetical protein [Yersinia enterocolitica]
MLKESAPQQYQLEMVTLEELVPQHHLVRKVDAAIDPVGLYRVLHG